MAKVKPTAEQLKEPSMYGYYPDVKHYDPISGNLTEVSVDTNSKVKFTSFIKALKAAETEC